MKSATILDDVSSGYSKNISGTTSLYYDFTEESSSPSYEKDYTEESSSSFCEEDYTEESSSSCEETLYLFEWELFQNIDLNEIKDKRVKENLNLFIAKYQQILKLVIKCIKHNDLRNVLPKFHMSVDEDGAAFLEYGNKNFRIGFNIESDFNNSFWYIVENNQLGEISQSEKLTKEGLDYAITRILIYVITHN